MSEDKPDLISRVHRFFGLKPSQETQEKLARSKEALVKMKSLGDQLAANTGQSQRELEDWAAQRKQESEIELQRSRERLAHMPKNIDLITDGEFIKQAALAGKRLSREELQEAMINQWDDGYGNILYLHPGIPMDQIQTISGRVTDERSIFDTLEPERQSQIRKDFESSKGTAENVQSYRDFLSSEALGKRFQALKQSQTPPK